MSDTVVTLWADTRLGDERKTQFLDGVAAAYDRYLADFGYAPDSLIYVLGGIRQSARVGYENNGDSADGATTMLSLAVMALTKEVVNPD